MVTLMPWDCMGNACNNVPKLPPSGKTSNVRSSSSGANSESTLRTYWVWLAVEEQATTWTRGGSCAKVVLGNGVSTPLYFRTKRPASLWTSST